MFVLFSYEMLPNFYYLCGLFGHTSRFCQLHFQKGFLDQGLVFPFGPWLRAMAPSGRVGRWLDFSPPSYLCRSAATQSPVDLRGLFLSRVVVESVGRVSLGTLGRLVLPVALRRLVVPLRGEDSGYFGNASGLGLFGGILGPNLLGRLSSSPSHSSSNWAFDGSLLGRAPHFAPGPDGPPSTRSVPADGASGLGFSKAGPSKIPSQMASLLSVSSTKAFRDKTSLISGSPSLKVMTVGSIPLPLQSSPCILVNCY
ncbi:hypothetical protein Salat_1492600 [Sesamum alatum]|uniref:Zinc knuckle CX2CX4HX4C domain-containing protein n=1 Tax=Sesamum alatum TaxID=300844 RepID=A0AAE1YBS9_9LAMI|nr:hypothetical protein Salat_1492600 [Sesamum alatum]